MSTVYGLPEVTGNEKSRSVPQSGTWSGDVPGGGEADRHCTNERFCNELPTSAFLWITALQKGIA